MFEWIQTMIRRRRDAHPEHVHEQEATQAAHFSEWADTLAEVERVQRLVRVDRRAVNRGHAPERRHAADR